MLNLFIFIFILIIIFYIIANYDKFFDMLILIFAIFVLLYVIINKKTIENFEEYIHDYKKIVLEEDISKIDSSASVYLTLFNKKSIDCSLPTISNWNNIVPNFTNLIFNFTPSISSCSKKTGLFLSNTVIKGPFSNQLNIVFNSTFTIVLACKHGNLFSGNQNAQIELLKLYANSTNNNGIALVIQENTIVSSNDTQVGGLYFQYGDLDLMPCLVNNTDTALNLEINKLYFYFMIKDTDSFKVYVMNESTNVINLVLNYKITNTDITFSNKECFINRFANWNGYLYNFSVFSKAFNDNDVSAFYTHFISEYIKNQDIVLDSLVSDYNSMIDTMQSYSKCPYDDETCNSCNGITKWNDMNQILQSSSACKSSINTFCSKNNTNDLCKCWDSTSTLFNSESCKAYRKLYSGEVTTEKKDNTNVNQEGIVSDSLIDTGLIKNTYGNYDWNKIKVTLRSQDLPNVFGDIILRREQETIQNPFESMLNTNKTLHINPIVDPLAKQAGHNPHESDTPQVNPNPHMNPQVNQNTQVTQPKIPDGNFDKFMRVTVPTI